MSDSVDIFEAGSATGNLNRYSEGTGTQAAGALLFVRREGHERGKGAEGNRTVWTCNEDEGKVETAAGG
jgi:hypothetical protein